MLAAGAYLIVFRILHIVAGVACGAPPPELVQEIQQMQVRLRVLARTNLAFVTLAVLTMATARYW